MIRDGRSINGYKPSEYMVSKKCLAAWSELCFRISKLKSPHIKIVLETDNSEYKSYKSLAILPSNIRKTSRMRSYLIDIVCAP